MSNIPTMTRETYAREWIPVDKGRPNTPRACLVTDGGRQYVAQFHPMLGVNGGWGHIVVSGRRRVLHAIEGATHWMELPELPDDPDEPETGVAGPID